MRFIMLKRKTDKTTVPTWVNVCNINMISAATVDPQGGTRIVMRDGFLLCEDEVSAVLEKIRRAEDDR